MIGVCFFARLFVSVQYEATTRISKLWLFEKKKIISEFSLPTAQTSPSVQASCNFDYGLCYGWSQSSSDIFDWTRRRGNTSSSNTGPSSDHTTGNGTYNLTLNNSTVSASYQSTRPFSWPLSIMAPKESLNCKTLELALPENILEFHEWKAKYSLQNTTVNINLYKSTYLL